MSNEGKNTKKKDYRDQQQEEELYREWMSFRSDSALDKKKSREIFSRILEDTGSAGKQKTAKQRIVPVLIPGIAAILIAGLIFSLLIYVQRAARESESGQQPDHQLFSFEAARGETKKIHLPDGSLVVLNSESRIAYDDSFGVKIRKVSLSGEAFFHVKKNPGKAFIVNARGISTKVLGTQFDVKAYPDDGRISVAVKEGTVSVYTHQAPDSSVLLVRQEKMVYHSKVRKFEKINLGENTDDFAWTAGKLIFNDIPLNDALKELERQYQVSFHLKNPAIGNCLLRGSFDNDPIYEIVEAISLSLNFNYEIDEKSRVITIDGKGCNK